MEAVENFIEAMDPWIEEEDISFLSESTVLSPMFMMQLQPGMQTNVFIISCGGEGAYALQLW